MTRFPAIALCAATIGCASSAARREGAPTVNESERVVGVLGTGTPMHATTTEGAVATHVTAAADTTFAAVTAVYTELGIQPDLLVPAERRIRRNFAGEPATGFFDCGTGVTGPRAATGRLSVNIATTVLPAGRGADVATIVSASVQPGDGTSTASLSCASTGRLEHRIAQLAAAKLAR
ncbi:MAG TPA: hypothetical protein VHM30_02120 [Gemmatimonadaceae bacterium]|nr:hypothetical protein [Gemmatimonadaceae bacterium]